MKKKDRKRLRELDRRCGLKVGTHEFFVATAKPQIKNVIMKTAHEIKEKKND